MLEEIFAKVLMKMSIMMTMIKMLKRSYLEKIVGIKKATSWLIFDHITSLLIDELIDMCEE